MPCHAIAQPLTCLFDFSAPLKMFVEGCLQLTDLTSLNFHLHCWGVVGSAVFRSSTRHFHVPHQRRFKHKQWVQKAMDSQLVDKPCDVVNYQCDQSFVSKNALKAYKDSLKLPLLSNFLQGDTVKLWGQQMKLSWRTTEKLRKWQGPGSCWARIDMEILLRMFQARLKIVECRSISIWITWYNIFII